MGIFSKKPKATKLQHLGELGPMISSGKPVLLDFFQIGCAPCQVMDGIMNELAREYGDSAHIVKVDVARVPGAAQQFAVRSTPTLVLLGPPPKKAGKGRITARWRATGLVDKRQLTRVLEGNGAVPIEG